MKLFPECWPVKKEKEPLKYARKAEALLRNINAQFFFALPKQLKHQYHTVTFAFFVRPEGFEPRSTASQDQRL